MSLLKEIQVPVPINVYENLLCSFLCFGCADLNVVHFLPGCLVVGVCGRFICAVVRSLIAGTWIIFNLT